MKKERETAASIDKQKGKVEAEKIKTDANQKKREEITKAEAQAKKLMAEGDAEAAREYAVFSQNPELAAFLRKLDSLKRIVKTKTTLVLGTDSAPFDLFRMNVGELQQAPAEILGHSGKSLLNIAHVLLTVHVPHQPAYGLARQSGISHHAVIKARVAAREFICAFYLFFSCHALTSLNTVFTFFILTGLPQKRIISLWKIPASL